METEKQQLRALTLAASVIMAVLGVTIATYLFVFASTTEARVVVAKYRILTAAEAVDASSRPMRKACGETQSSDTECLKILEETWGLILELKSTITQETAGLQHDKGISAETRLELNQWTESVLNNTLGKVQERARMTYREWKKAKPSAPKKPTPPQALYHPAPTTPGAVFLFLYIARRSYVS